MRKNGDIISTTIGRKFRIVEAIGQGGFSQVYRADEIADFENEVLLKEFVEDSYYPMDEYIQRELNNNDVISASGFSGALTIQTVVYEEKSNHAFGVMQDVRLGKTLYQYVKSEDWKRSSLAQRVQTGRRIFHLLDAFHLQCRLAHGDVRPDNIFLYDTGVAGIREDAGMVALIDFGCSMPLDSVDLNEMVIDDVPFWDLYFFNQPVSDAKDWEMALDCLWFVLTGREVIEYQISKEHLVESIQNIVMSYSYNAFSGNEFAERFIENRGHYEQQIISKLNRDFFSRRDFTNRLCSKIDEVYDLTLETGVSKERLYAYLCDDYESMRKNRFAELDILRKILPGVGFESPKGKTRLLYEGTSDYVQLHDLIGTSDQSYIMVGDGGIGKTTSLIDIMDRAYGEESMQGRIVIFLELCVLSQNTDEWYDEMRGGTFIEQFIASYYLKQPRDFADKAHPVVMAVREELFRVNEDGRREYVILLDGLNEIGFLDTKSRHRFYETMNHYLQYGHNMQLVITGRSDAYELSREHLRRLQTIGLDDIGIKDMLQEALEQNHIEKSEYLRLLKNKDNISSAEYRLWSCLRIPFFIKMYCSISERMGLTRQGEILQAFFQDKRETLDGSVKYGERSQSDIRYGEKGYNGEDSVNMALSIRVVLDMVIPEVALQMAVNSQFYITGIDLRKFLEEMLPKLKENIGLNWPKWHYGYELDVSEVIGKIYQIDHGERIAEYACDVLGIMRQTADGALFFTHQYFRDYFAAGAVVNHMLNFLELSDNGAKEIALSEMEELLYPIHKKELSRYICSLTGEILGEHHNMPVYKKRDGVWDYTKAVKREQDVIEHLLDCYRYKKWNSDDGAMLAVKNLIQILKYSRVQNIRKADLTGVSFDGLNLTGVSLHDVVLSHYNTDTDVLTASFKSTNGAVSSIQMDESENVVRCVGIHPAENIILLYDESRNILSELNLDNGESQLIAENIQNLTSALYCPDTYDILFLKTITVSKQDAIVTDEKDHRMLISRMLESVKLELEEARDIDARISDNDGRGFIDRFLSFIRLEYDYDDDDDDFLDEEVEETTEEREVIGCYDRRKNCVLYSDNNLKDVVKVFEEKDYGVLNVLLHHKGSKADQMVRIGNKLEKSGNIVECDAIGSLAIQYIFGDNNSGKWVVRQLNDKEYLIGKLGNLPFSIGLWNAEDNQISTVLCVDQVDGRKFKCRALAKGSKFDEILYLPENSDDIQKYKIDYKNKSEYSFFQNHSMPDISFTGTDMICTCANRNQRLVYCHNKASKRLYLIDISKMEKLWTLPCDVFKFFYRDEILIVNTADGIFRVDMLNGNMTCVKDKGITTAGSIMGQTDSDKLIVLYDNRQTVKWIDVENGQVSYFSILQETGKVCSKIYASVSGNFILGISGKAILCWNSTSGELTSVAHVRDDSDAEFKRMDFYGRNPEIIVYRKRMDYSTYPPQEMTKTAQMQIQVVNGKCILGKETESEGKGKLNILFSDDVEIMEVPKGELTGKEEKETVSQTFFMDGITEGYLLENKITWIQEDDFSEYENKAIYIVEPDSFPMQFLAKIKSQDKVIGVINGMALYSDSLHYDGPVLMMAKQNYKETITFRELRGRHVKAALTVGHRAVFLTEKPSESGEEILFWNFDTEEVYKSTVNNGILGSGCLLSTQSEGENDLLEAEGMTASKGKKVIALARRAFTKKKIKLRTPVERLTAMNWPILLLCPLLIIFGLCGTVAAPAFSYGVTFTYTEILEEMGRYASFFYMKPVIICIVVGIFMKLVFPSLLEGVSSYRFSLCGFAAFIFAEYMLNNSIEEDLLLMSEEYASAFAVGFLLGYTLYVSILVKEKSKGYGYIVDLFIMELIIVTLYYRTNVSAMVLIDAEVLMALTFYFVTRKRKVPYFVKILRKSIPFGLLFCIGSYAGLCYYYISGQTSRTWLRMDCYLERQDWIRSVLINANLFGSAGNFDSYDGTIEYLNCSDCFVAFLADTFGWVAVVALIILFVLLFKALFNGAKRQSAQVDRSICMGCAAYILLQTVVYFISDFGLLPITAGMLPFSGTHPWGNTGAYFALLIYIACYHSHKVQRMVNEE